MDTCKITRAEFENWYCERYRDDVDVYSHALPDPYEGDAVAWMRDTYDDAEEHLDQKWSEYSTSKELCQLIREDADARIAWHNLMNAGS